MKLRNVKRMYVVKEIVLGSTLPESDKDRIIKATNEMLLDEGGVQAVLYPYNTYYEEIRTLHSQGMTVDMIAAKLGIDNKEAIEVAIEEI